MVELLSSHTSMTVLQAVDGAPPEPNHVYLIPPGVSLAIQDGVLRLSKPLERHGARLPFDFFLTSLAVARGDRAVCVVLSGTGRDGSVGILAIKEKGGLVIVQDPEEAEFDGMPLSAIATGAVDLVASVADIPELISRKLRPTPSASMDAENSLADPCLMNPLRLSRFFETRPSMISVLQEGHFGAPPRTSHERGAGAGSLVISEASA